MKVSNQALQVISAVRTNVSKHLPICNSFLPLDMLLMVLHDTNNDGVLTVKQLFASLPYSETGLRYHFGRLVNDGWLELDLASSDKRIKIVKPTLKLKSHFDNLSASLKL